VMSLAKSMQRLGKVLLIDIIGDEIFRDRETVPASTFWYTLWKYSSLILTGVSKWNQRGKEKTHPSATEKWVIAKPFH
jgi:hypothetical protein